jgi:hypothetical protein
MRLKTTLAAVAGSAALLLASAGTAAASPAATQTAAAPAVVTEVIGGFYADGYGCSLAGTARVGTVYGIGVVVSYDCGYNGVPFPLGPYVLYLFIDVPTCSNVTPMGGPVSAAVRSRDAEAVPAKCE